MAKDWEHRKEELRRMAEKLEKTLQCNCDLDNWQPTPLTGHSEVCRIHKVAMHSLMGGRG